MDLMNLTPTSDTVEVNLLHPNTGEAILNEDKTPMTITLYASHSKEHKAAMHKQTNKRLKLMQGKKSAEFTSEDIEEATLVLLSQITKEWNITYGKEVPTLTATKAKEVYQNVFWIKEQLEEALTESLDFTKS